MKGLYVNGDSVVWGAELEDKVNERFSKLLANNLGMIELNNASAGVSNDYIYRQTLRDVLHWEHTKMVWSEDCGWIHIDNLFVIIGWTAPTRFEWWDGNSYIQERLWTGYDKWGAPDADKTMEDQFVLNQTEVLPSYIRTLNHINSLSAILEVYKIPYYFFNIFYEYDNLPEPTNKIDLFGKDDHQVSFNYLFNSTPESFRSKTMYTYIKEHGGNFLPRRHPEKKSHRLWADFLVSELTKSNYQHWINL